MKNSKSGGIRPLYVDREFAIRFKSEASIRDMKIVDYSRWLASQGGSISSSLGVVNKKVDDVDSGKRRRFKFDF